MSFKLTSLNYLNNIINSIKNKVEIENLSFNNKSNNYAPNIIKTIYSQYPFFQQGYAVNNTIKNAIGVPLVGPNVIDMNRAYNNCCNLTGQPVCGQNVINMVYAYQNCCNLTGQPVCGQNVINMDRAYNNCCNLTGQPVCGQNVNNMAYTYQNCYNLTGQPVCGQNVINMVFAYFNCYNLTGQPVCGQNVNNMAYTYNNCCNLTGQPVCGPKVISMVYAYQNCCNLTGQPVCGQNVNNLSNSYLYCKNLTGQPLIKNNNLLSAEYAFDGCYNINGTLDFGAEKFNPTGIYNYIFKDCVHLGGLIVYGTNGQITRARWNNAFNRVGAPVGLPYNQENTYNVGDLIWYNNNGYRCIKAINIPEQLDLNKWELNNNVVNGYWRLNIITNVQAVATNLRLETGCDMTAIATVNEIVDVPYALPNGQIYGYRHFHCIRNCYNEFYNIYIYVADREEV